MSDLLLLKFFAVLLTLVAALVGGIWPIWKRSQLNLSVTGSLKPHSIIEFPATEAIAAGIFLAAGLLHMLADSTKDFINIGYHYPVSYLIAATAFLFLLGLEHITGQLKEKGQYLQASLAILTAVMLIIHSLLEGLAVGISGSLSIVFIIFMAIIAHKSAASFALSAQLSRSTLSIYAVAIVFTIFTLMTPLGIVIGGYVATLHHHTLLTPIFTALAAGTFLYIGTLHGFERASLIHRCCNLKEFFLMLAGFAIMAIVAIC